MLPDKEVKEKTENAYMDAHRSLFEDIFAVHEPYSIDLKSIDRAARSIDHAMEAVGKAIRPNMTTQDVASIINAVLRADDVDSSPIIRISPEEVVWHGLPGGRILQEGEIVSIDVACSVRGWWADASMTFPIGSIDEKRARLIDAAKEGTKCIVECTRDGCDGRESAVRLSNLCGAFGVRLVAEAAGHGVGRTLHADPLITYDGRTHEPLTEGFVYTAEPIFTCGDGRVKMVSDGSVVTADGEPAAHFEVSVLTLPDGPQILGAPNWISGNSVLTHWHPQ